MFFPYKNEKQLEFVQSLIERPLVFHHGTYESYPEIEIHIKKEYKPSYVLDLLERILKDAGYTKEMVELKSYDNGERGYNEVVLYLDLRCFENEEIEQLIAIVQHVVIPYGSLSDVPVENIRNNSNFWYAIIHEKENQLVAITKSEDPGKAVHKIAYELNLLHHLLRPITLCEHVDWVEERYEDVAKKLIG